MRVFLQRVGHALKTAGFYGVLVPCCAVLLICVFFTISALYGAFLGAVVKYSGIRLWPALELIGLALVFGLVRRLYVKRIAGANLRRMISRILLVAASVVLCVQLAGWVGLEIAKYRWHAVGGKTHIRDLRKPPVSPANDAVPLLERAFLRAVSFPHDKFADLDPANIPSADGTPPPGSVWRGPIPYPEEHFADQEPVSEPPWWELIPLGNVFIDTPYRKWSFTFDIWEGPLDDDHLLIFRQYVEANRESIQLAMEAAERPTAAWPEDYTDVSVDDDSYLNGAHTLIWALAAQARLHMIDGQPEQAAKLVTRMHRLGLLVSAPNTFNSRVAGFRYDTFAMYAMQLFFQSASADLSEMEASLASRDYTARFREDVQVESTRQYWWYRHGRDYSGLFSAWIFTGAGWLDAKYHLDEARAIVLATTAPMHEIESRFLLLKSPRWRLFPILTMIPRGDRVWFSYLRAQTQTNAALVCLRLRQYRQSHGQYPSSLAALGNVPVDPIDGQPFDYRRVDDGFVLQTRLKSPSFKCVWRWR